MKYAVLKTAAIASAGLLKVNPARLVAMVTKNVSNVAWAYHDHHNKQIVALVPLQSIISESRPGQHAEKDWSFPVVVEATERWSTIAYKGKDGVLRAGSQPCVLSRPEGYCVGQMQLTLTGFAAGLVSPRDRYSEYFPDYASAERWCNRYLAANYHREEGFFPPGFIPAATDYPHAVADSAMYKHRGREEAYGLPAGHVIRLESPLDVEALRQEMATERAERRAARSKGAPLRFIEEHDVWGEGWIPNGVTENDNGDEIPMSHDTLAGAIQSVVDDLRMYDKEIATGEREADEGYDPAEFRIRDCLTGDLYHFEVGQGCDYTAIGPDGVARPADEYTSAQAQGTKMLPDPSIGVPRP